MCLQENLGEKYQVMGYVTSMHVDMGMRFSVNFSHEKILLGKIMEFIGTGTWMPV